MSDARPIPPAPLDRAELDKAMLPFGQSRMLPRAAYVDEAVLDWERQHVFTGWTCAGRATDLDAAGSLRTFGLGRTSVLLARDDEKTLHAFENACRHRGHELAHRRHFVGRGWGRLPG